MALHRDPAPAGQPAPELSGAGLRQDRHAAVPDVLLLHRAAGRLPAPKLSAATLRPVRAGDEELLLRIYAGTRAEELAGVDWPAGQKDAFLRQQFAAQSQWYREQYEGASFDVIEVDGRGAGRLYVARWPAEIRIMDIALLPEYRGQGIGSALLADLMAEATAHAKPLTIHVERFNRALRLYERLGFTPVADKGVYLLLRWAATAG